MRERGEEGEEGFTGQRAPETRSLWTVSTAVFRVVERRTPGK